MLSDSVRVEHARVQWSSVVGGAIVALATFIVLGMFSTAISGAFADDHAIRGVSNTGSMFFTVLIGSIIAPIVAGVLGGLVSFRLSGTEHEPFAILHGVLAWCLTILAGSLLFGLFGRFEAPIAAPHSGIVDFATVYGRTAAFAAWSGLAAIIGGCAAAWGAYSARQSMRGGKFLPRIRLDHRTPVVERRMLKTSGA
jgi:hypothetical protein